MPGRGCVFSERLMNIGAAAPLFVFPGCVPVLVTFLTHESLTLQHQSLWALGNIAGRSSLFYKHYNALMNILLQVMLFACYRLDP